MDPLLSGILGIGNTLINKLIPDPAQKAAAQLQLLQLQQQGELDEIKLQLSAIIAEAQSNDPWTSRARPSFLYVMYLMILFAFPMGVLFLTDPARAQGMIDGVHLWLSAIPEQMWTLFGIGYLGYTGARTWEKVKS